MALAGGRGYGIAGGSPVADSTIREETAPAVRARWFWLASGWTLVGLVIYLSLAPIGIDTGVVHGDKLSHVAAYTVLMVWFASLYATVRGRLGFAAGFIAMGVALEIVQGWIGYRQFEVADMLADAAGVAAGWALAPPRLPNFLLGIERRLWP
ncbi:MAG: VanZ family protein [Burkholderiales bacterium]|nr:VanZ family protein [Burkholderiales bacterium]